MKTVPLNTVIVNRDAVTKVPTTVPPHEIPVLQAIFGEDNVQVTAENVDTIEVDETTEGERLVGKYGLDRVKEVFGSGLNGAVAKAVSSHEVAAKGSKARATAPA